MRRRQRPLLTCRFCRQKFTPKSRRQYTCGAAECVRERKRLCAEEWYAVNQKAHQEKTKLANRRRRRREQS